MLVVALAVQLAQRRYVPGVYWSVVVIISVVGTLMIVHARELRARDRRRGAARDRLPAVSRDLPPADAVVALQERSVGILAQVRLGVVVEIADEPAQHRAHLRTSGAEITHESRHERGRLRLDRLSRLSRLARGRDRDETELRAVGEPAGDLRRALNGTEAGVAPARAQLRRAADPPRVEDALAGTVAAEETHALLEEWTPLIEPHLEGTQVEHRGVGFHLTEVGIDGRVDSDVAREAGLDVHARTLLLRMLPSTAHRRETHVLRDDVRQHLEPAVAADALDADEVAQLRGQGVARRAIERPRIALAVARDITPDAEPEQLRGAGIEAQLVINNRESSRLRGRRCDAVHLYRQ